MYCKQIAEISKQTADLKRHLGRRRRGLEGQNAHKCLKNNEVKVCTPSKGGFAFRTGWTKRPVCNMGVSFPSPFITGFIFHVSGLSVKKSLNALTLAAACMRYAHFMRYFAHCNMELWRQLSPHIVFMKMKMKREKNFFAFLTDFQISI